MIIPHKHCSNCRACIIWNPEEKRWECKLCGNAEETKPNKNIPRYIN